MTIEFNHKACDLIKDVSIIESNSFKDDRGKLWSSYTNEYFCNISNTFTTLLYFTS